MSPPDSSEDHGEPGGAEAAKGAGGGEAPADGPRGEPQPLGILFIAAAIALALLLTIVGLLAVAAMSRMPAPAGLGELGRGDFERIALDNERRPA